MHVSCKPEIRIYSVDQEIFVFTEGGLQLSSHPFLSVSGGKMTA